MKAPFILAVILLFAIPCFAQESKLLPDAPKVHRIHFDSGWLARVHWTAAAFDYATTGLANKECLAGHFPNTCSERDPLARPFIGRHPEPLRLSFGFAAESAAVSLIPNKKVRRIVQIGFIGSHLFLGARNLSYWH